MQRPPKAIAKERLQKQLDAITELKQLPRPSPGFDKWRRDTEAAIANTFGESSRYINDFRDIKYTLTLPSRSDATRRMLNNYVGGLQQAAAILESMIHEIEEYWEDDSQSLDSSENLEMRKQTNTSQAFIIHGRDYGTRDMVARFLESLEIKPVILQEQPDQGRTVIEKFEQYAQVDFAIALFTPDDVGGLGDDNLQPRARQNVIFEFGYFIGKFGRHRVRALVKGDIEIPSDYSGVVYIPLDESGSWKMALIREMKNEGFNIDANRLFE